jgi:hypothetical protein
MRHEKKKFPTKNFLAIGVSEINHKPSPTLGAH